MNLLADLTDAQREAVTHIDGPILVLAGAGSGKTRVITRRVAHLLGSGIPADSILAVTFTNKAAGEMRERIDALVPNSRVWVGTFHGICARLLRRYAKLVGIDPGFTIYDQNDRRRAVKDLMDQVGWDLPGWTPERVESAISRAKNDLVSPEAWRRRAADRKDALLAQVYDAYEKRLRESSAVDFDDLLVHMVAILKEHKDVRADLDRRYRYVLVDEYQDTNLAQYAIVRALSVDYPNLCVTGDPDQSIYGWHGADIKNILEFERDYPGGRVVTLQQNYRSTKNILSVADHLIRNNRNRKPKSLLTDNPRGAPVELTVYSRETDEAEGVAARIVGLVREGDYGFADVAVLCRMTALTRPFEQAFRAARIPYQIVGGVAFYERQEVKDVLGYLNLTVNPKDDLAFLRVVNVPPRGLGKTSIEVLSNAAREQGVPLLSLARRAWTVPGLKEKAAKAFDDFARLMDGLSTLRELSAEEVVSRLLVQTGYREHLAAEAKGSGEERLANLDELITAAREFDQVNPGSSIQDLLAEITLASPIDRWDQDTGAVTLMTLHAAKGLEFPAVFIVALEDGILPHARGNESHAELEEERRLLFVGITRARRELYLSRCCVRSFRGQQQATMPSRFLAELPEEAMSVRDLSELGSPDVWHRPAGGQWAARRAEARPAAPPSFRLTTAADLAARGAGAAATPAATDLDALRVGTSVLHPEYGLGKIVAVEGAGPNRKGRVAFAVGPERTFVLARSPLRTVGRGTPDAPPPRRPATDAPSLRHHAGIPGDPAMSRLGVNIDHVATLRQARGGREPDPVWAAAVAELNGADGITIHLREDRRHIQDRDLRLLRETVQVRLNLEMAVEPSIVELAPGFRPDQVTLVPERREELTTEGGLDVAGQVARVGEAVRRIAGAGIGVSLFIDPEPRQVEAAIAMGVAAVELHTGRYADAPEGPARHVELEALRRAGASLMAAGVGLHAGHGLNYRNVGPVAQLDRMAELNIGHSIVSRAIFVGLGPAVREMKDRIDRALLGPTG